MTNSVYRIIEAVGTSTKSWDDAARSVMETAGRHLRDLRIAEVQKLDVVVEEGKVTAFRVRLSLSFKYEEEPKKKKK
jgi:dodecin